MAALIIGAVGGILVFYAVPFFDKLKIDDPVGALSVHLVNGIWGTIATGIWGKGVSFVAQIKGIIEVGIFVFVLSFVILYIINKIIPFRANEEDNLKDWM